MNEYPSIIDENLLQYFDNHISAANLYDFAVSNGAIDARLAFGVLLWPDLLEENGFIFKKYTIAANFESTEKLSVQDIRRVERYTNLQSIDGTLEGEADTPQKENRFLQYAYARMLRFFWSLRLNTTFPNRNFIVEIGENMEGDAGLSITFYEQTRSASTFKGLIEAELFVLDSTSNPDVSLFTGDMPQFKFPSFAEGTTSGEILSALDKPAVLGEKVITNIQLVDPALFDTPLQSGNKFEFQGSFYGGAGKVLKVF